MTGIKRGGIVLIAVLLLAGSAKAGENPVQDSGSSRAEQVGLANETAIPSGVTQTGSEDGGTSEKESAITGEPAPKADPVPEVIVSPWSEAAEEADEAVRSPVAVPCRVRIEQLPFAGPDFRT